MPNIQYIEVKKRNRRILRCFVQLSSFDDCGQRPTSDLGPSEMGGAELQGVASFRPPVKIYIHLGCTQVNIPTTTTIKVCNIMTADTQSAVAALVAAKDISSLEQAIAAASFLDTVPGDDRQKLRGK
jgi:hypothetical protein